MSPPEDTRSVGLLDAEDRHRAAPHSFSIPRSDVRRALGVGARVKLLFGFGSGDPPAAERMWVEVIEAPEEATGREGRRYVGRLVNTPEVISDLTDGARVVFGPEHVAAIWREMPDEPQPGQFAIVSARVWLGGAVPAHAVRRAVPDAAFSGWIVSAAEDPEPPPGDLAGYRPVSHLELTGRYRSFDSIEDEPPDTAWRWDPEALEWTPEGEPTAPG